MKEEIDVFLLVRRLGAVALRVCHRAADHDICRLRALQK
jgi:hypothetical protein